MELVCGNLEDEEGDQVRLTLMMTREAREAVPPALIYPGEQMRIRAMDSGRASSYHRGTVENVTADFGS